MTQMSSHRFADTVAIVIGGGRGIGRATALRLASEGAHVVVADSAVEYASEVAEDIQAAGGTAESGELDATDPSSVGRFFYRIGESHPRLDVLINCPAHASDTHFEKITDHEFDVDMAVTLKAPFLCIQAALPLLLRSPVASVINISSINGLTAFGNEAYGAAKAGLMNLTKNLAVRYGPLGVRFNAVAPGTVRTRSWEGRIAGSPGMLEQISELYPLRRVGAPEDIAAACAFLASTEASWITGTTLTVDGGITAGDVRFIEAAFGPSFFETTLGDRPNQ